MASAAVVEDLDVLEDRVRELDSGLPPSAVEKLDLHRGPEALHHSVVQAVSDRSEGRQEAGRADLLPEDPGGELGPVVGVDD